MWPRRSPIRPTASPPRSSTAPRATTDSRRTVAFPPRYSGRDRPWPLEPDDPHARVVRLFPFPAEVALRGWTNGGCACSEQVEREDAAWASAARQLKGSDPGGSADGRG